MGNKGIPEGIKTVFYWGIGIGSLALLLLILVILFGNLQGNVGFGQDTVTIYNETITLSAGATPATAVGKVNPSLASVVVTNATTGGAIVNSANYTIDGASFTPTGSSEFDGLSVNVSAILSYDEAGKVDSDNLIQNYTKSATNTSKQFPVVGTILGVVLLLVILIGALVFAVRKMMGIAGSTGSGSLGRKSSSFEGSSQSLG